jgi:hypothetical protein
MSGQNAGGIVSSQLVAGVAIDDDPKVLALQTFERWSNYLLVTTVAAAGWIATKNLEIGSGWRDAALWCFGVSIVFGILTLALVPLVAQAMTRDHDSIYRVPAQFKLLFRYTGTAFLTQACRPQHVSFIAGIAMYCIGTTTSMLQEWKVPVIIAVSAILFGVLSRPWGKDRESIPPGGFQKARKVTLQATVSSP